MKSLRLRLTTLMPALAICVLPVGSGALANGNLVLTLSGASDAVSNNIRSHLDLEALSCDLPELQLRSRLSRIDNRISRALRALGHYNGDWQVKTDRRNDCWHIELTVDPGEPVKVATVDVRLEGEAADDPAFTRYLDNLPVAPGHQLNHSAYESIKTGIEQRARTRGYFDGRFSERILRVNTEDNTAAISLTYNSGPRYRFGETHFPDADFDPTFLRGFLPFAEGDPYDSDKLINFQRALTNSQYFSYVDVDQRPGGADDHSVDTLVALTPRQRYQTRFSVGASTDTGPRVGFGFSDRRTNDRGHTYDLSSQWSPVESNAAFQYKLPGRDPASERTTFGAGWQDQDTDTAKSTSYHLETTQVTVKGKWLQTIRLRFLEERFEIADETETTMLLMPGIGWSRTHSNDPRYPTRGWRLNTSLRGALEGALSDTTLTQVSADAKLILPLFNGRLITRASGGATIVDSFTQLPASLRFFAGGDNSVRGFAYQALGPTNSEGDVIGGKYLLAGSVEYDYPIRDNYGAAIFYDAGNAFDNSEFTLKDSVGFGARWRSPIGPVRVDLAFPLDGGGVRLHLSMGPDL